MHTTVIDIAAWWTLWPKYPTVARQTHSGQSEWKHIHHSHQQSYLRHWLVLLWLWLLSCCYCYRHRDIVATRLHAFVDARSLCLGLLWHGLSAGLGQLHQNTLWLHRCLKKLWLLKSFCCHWLSTPRQPSVQILETEEWGQKVHEGIVCMAFCCFAGHNSIQRYCNPDLLECRTAASHWMPESPLRSFWSFGKPDWFMTVLMMAWHACWLCSHLTTAGWLADLVADCAGWINDSSWYWLRKLSSSWKFLSSVSCHQAIPASSAQHRYVWPVKSHGNATLPRVCCWGNFEGGNYGRFGKRDVHCVAAPYRNKQIWGVVMLWMLPVLPFKCNHLSEAECETWTCPVKLFYIVLHWYHHVQCWGTERYDLENFCSLQLGF